MGWGLALCTIVALVVAACSSGPKLSLRHKESGLNSAFRYGDMTYPDYVAHMRQVIAQTRTDLTPEREATIVGWNSPFIREPDPARCPAAGGRYRDGILMIHGLTDSPFHMWDLTEFFVRKCFVVYGLLLPGHGTVPGDLLAVTYNEWIKALNYGVDAVSARAARVFIAGFSTGGSLAVHAALTDERVKGIVLFAPALALHSKEAFLAGSVDTFSGEKGRWIDMGPDEDPAKYESFPLNAAAQIWKLTFELSQMRRTRHVDAPIFIALSQDDMTVDSLATVEFFRAQANPLSRMLVYSRAPADWGDSRIVSRPSVYPAEHILNFAHLSLTNAPENPHYGRQGDYRNCLHYLKDPASWKICKQDAVPLGELNEELLAQGVLRRLTYNPDFAHMLRQMDAFLDSVK
jgi:esterase/lipase